MANFPTSVSTTDQLHTGVNNLATALTSAINALVVTIPVSSTTGFPSVGAITIDSERISYTSTNPTNFLGCTRGFGLTTAASHVISRPVELTYGAEYHNDLRDEIIALEQNLSDRIGLDAGSHDIDLQLNTLFLGSDGFNNPSIRFDDGDFNITLNTYNAPFLNGPNTTGFEFLIGNQATPDAAFRLHDNTISLESRGPHISIQIEAGEGSGDIFLGSTVPATTDTYGFLRIPAVDNTPTGVPDVSDTSHLPIVYDYTANKLYIYNHDSSSWKSVLFT